MSNPPSEQVRQAANIVEAYLKESAAKDGRVTDEQFARMSARDRIEYCRRFPQNSLPAWKDPRG